MAYKSNSNNRIIPANSRAVDVASKAVYEVLGAQQARTYNAFRVQGYQGLLYNRIQQGRKCTCQASQKALNARLDKEGKASVGAINQLLTGSATFDVSPYGSRQPPENPFTSEVAPAAADPYLGVFDIVSKEVDTYPNSRVPLDQDFGDNGPIDTEVDIEALVGDFDASHVGFTDVTCAICFGTGFVGGYQPFHGHRQVLTPQDMAIDESSIDYSLKPWTVTTLGSSVACRPVFPLGGIGVDAMRLWNGSREVPVNFIIDGQPVNTPHAVLKFCDGRPHDLEIQLKPDTTWTHLELQFITSTESPYFEFPRLTKGSDTSLLEQLEPFQIIMSPNVPSVRPEDVIVESTFGKTLVVQNSNWWNTRQRDTLGWECQVRVIQPQELYRILPHRGRIMTKERTTTMTQDNVNGYRRT